MEREGNIERAFGIGTYLSCSFDDSATVVGHDHRRIRYPTLGER
jgi:hypothetical protein